MELKMNFSTTYFFIINVLIFVLSFFMFYLLNKKKTYENDKDVDLNYYEKAYLYKGPNFIYNPIIAMILKAKAHGDIEMEKNIYTNKIGEDKVEYILKNLNSSRLDNGERKLFETLFSLGDGDSISTRQMDKLRRTEADNYNKKFNDFIYFLEDEMVKKKLFTIEKNTLKIFISFVIFSILFFVGIVTVYNEKFFGIASIVFSLFFYASLIKSFSKMTDLGNKKFRELEKVEEGLRAGRRLNEEDFLLALGFGLKYENVKSICQKLDDKTYEIYLDEDFYKTFRTALVGDHLLVRN
ncbi:DUF2207 family protein [Peptoniphilus genitalis]|uniref:DUF2207 domain-containing protein n=1 Tax=Peptoniphilus genitalis TaxID=3036303 RepID=A0ABY4TU61_9FIRM|nr:DUF2207 domain-containing protein [Peptoniphilus sp. SAHP1]URN41926.1 DUF2207 domain-containing protein [Peptoniphilus sp. SAHP1]